jgi:hypothetical protein
MLHLYTGKRKEHSFTTADKVVHALECFPYIIRNVTGLFHAE